jgi:hypothetical protein
MHRSVRGLVVLACASALYAPAQQASRPQPPAGLETDWDIAVVLNEIANHATRLLPLLEQADSNAWVAKGAPDSYARQLRSSREQARALADGAKALAQSPEKLSAGLELFFRLQGLQNMVGTVAEALRKYQSRADADALIAASAEVDANRDRFQQYLVNLAGEREKEYVVMDQEAQRCRGILTAPPPRKK